VQSLQADVPACAATSAGEALPSSRCGASSEVCGVARGRRAPRGASCEAATTHAVRVRPVKAMRLAGVRSKVCDFKTLGGDHDPCAFVGTRRACNVAYRRIAYYRVLP
jgi:hypothetical protein